MGPCGAAWTGRPAVQTDHAEDATAGRFGDRLRRIGPTAASGPRRRSWTPVGRGPGCCRGRLRRLAPPKRLQTQGLPGLMGVHHHDPRGGEPHAGLTVDEVRRSEQRRQDPADAKALKGTRYALLKHPGRLKPGEARRLETLRRETGRWNRAYELKEIWRRTWSGDVRGCAGAAGGSSWSGLRGLLGAVREAGAHDSEPRGRHPGVSGHEDDERSCGEHQQQAACDYAASVRFPLGRCPHLDAVPVLRRHRTVAAATHTHLRRFMRRCNGSQEKLVEICENKYRVLVIHYSCESFYDRGEVESPRVTSIAVRNLATAQTKSFSITSLLNSTGKFRQRNRRSLRSVGEKDARRVLRLCEKHEGYIWLHWNMRDAKYGFEALEHRFKVHNETPSGFVSYSVATWHDYWSNCMA